MSMKVSYKKQIVFGIFFMLLILLVIEILIRSYDMVFPNCIFIGSDVLRNLDYVSVRTICSDNLKLKWNNLPLRLEPNQHFQSININSDGFRGHELKNDTEYRIFVVGGSTAFGVGATSDGQTISSHLEQNLKKITNLKLEVINAGIPGAWSNTETELIENKIIQYHPNLILIYDGWNDLDETSKNTITEDKKFQELVLRTIIQSDYLTPRILLQLYFDYNNIHEGIEFPSSGVSEKATIWKNNHIQTCQLGKIKNYKTIIVLQPLLGTGNKILSGEEMKSYIHHDALNRISHYELFANKSVELNVACDLVLDLRNVFDSQNETMYYDAGHVGDNGNRIIALKIHEKILPLILNDLKLL